MGVPVSELVTRAEAVVSALGHAPSTLWQYRWAWSQIELFCAERGADELTEEVSASFLGFAAAEYRRVRFPPDRGGISYKE